MAFTPVATTDTLETFRTRYNATNITLVDDASTSVDITLATDSLKISGGTGTASVISGDTLTLNLSNTGVSAASYGSSTAIPVLAVNAQGQITSASTASISTDLTVIDDASTAATISLASDSLKISGGTGLASSISGDVVTINDSNTGVSAASYGSSTAIPVIAVNAQGRITSASTASVSTDLTIIDDSSTAATISLGSDTLKFAGGTGISTAISGDVLTITKSGSSAHRTLFKYTATSGQTTFSGSDANSNTLAYSTGNFDVFLNGVLLDATDFTASNGTSVVLASGAAASDILSVLAYQTESLIQNDMNGGELILDADADTSITADTDDQIDIKIAGADDFQFTANTFTAQSGSTIAAQALTATTITTSSTIDVNGNELILDADADTSIHASTDDQVDIKIGGTDRFVIASTGAVSTVTTAADASLTLQSTHADALGAGLVLYQNSASPADNDILAVITGKGRNDNSQDVVYSQIKTTATDVSDGAEDGDINIFTMKAGTATEQVRIEHDGDLHVDGDVIGFSTTVSDVALKTDIQVIPNALDKLDEITGYTFTRHNGKKSAGIIAQELEKVLPEAINEKMLPLQKDDNKKYKTVEYDAIHGLLIQAIKELKDEIRGNK
tara:strand:- start:264 stop:2126 length:1863 start_codon:yes stop_codon:yes gene_type:complete